MYYLVAIGKNKFGDYMKLSEKYYKKTLKEHEVKPKYFMRVILAFGFGGLISLIGQAILELAKLQFTDDESKKIMLLTVIFVAIILSGFGLYDKIGQIAYAGTIIPITGFANSVASSAMEYRPEGLILGIGANTFKLAGSVIVYGIVGTIVFGLIRILFGWI